MNFTAIDAAIIMIYLAATIYAGLRVKKIGEDSAGYFGAGRRVGLSLGVATLVASEIGIVTFMYMAEFGFTMGYSGFVVGLLGMIGFIFIGYSGFIVSGLRKFKIMTVPEFYEIKYDKKVRLLGGVILFISGMLNMGIFLKFDALFLSETMGLGQDALLLIMIVMLIVVIGYTILGGMLSVIVTDFMQFIVITASMLVITILILHRVSFAEMTQAVAANYGQGGFNPFKHARLGWFFIGWNLFANLATGGLHQPIAAKAFSAKSPKVARRVFLFFGLTLAGRSMIPMIWGIAALAYFGPRLSPVLGMPRLIATVAPTGLLGIILAGMLAASMSTYSAYLLSWSSVATRDILTPLKKKPLSEAATIAVSRIFSLLIGLFLLVFGLLYEIPETAYQYLYITGTMYASGAFATVAGGLYWKKANRHGAMAALSIGIVMPLLFLVLTKCKSVLPGSLSFLTDVNMAGFIGMLLPLASMIVVSLCTQKSCPAKILAETEENA